MAMATSSTTKDTIELAPVRTQTRCSDTEMVIIPNLRTTTIGRKPLLHNHWVHVSALCYMFFVEGWNDGTTGPLVPVLRSSYRINFTLVSLLFVVGCMGIVIGAGSIVWFERVFGFGKTIVIGAILQTIAYVVASTAPPFAALAVGHGIAGFGICLEVSQGNAFVGNMMNQRSLKLSLLHAFYGMYNETFKLRELWHHLSFIWERSLHHCPRHTSRLPSGGRRTISACFALVNTVVLCVVFRFKRKQDLLTEEDEAPEEASAGAVERNMYRQILGMRGVYILTVFAILYTGVEVTIGGWIVTFIIEERDGGPASGYISSGFFGGLALGRLVLIWLNSKVGEYRVIFLYGILAIALEVTIWTIPSLIQNAIAVSIVGLLLGPMFPLLIGHASRIIPTTILTGSLNLITGLGSAGATAFPFATGVLASRYGILALQPLLVAMMAVMVGTWAFVPKDRRID